MADHAQRSRLRVAAPEQEHVGVLRDIRIQVRVRGHLADGLAAPDVLRAPVPAFPGVHVPHLQRVAAHQRQQTVRAAVARGHALSFAVHVALAEHGLRAVSLLHPDELVRTDLRGFVPGDADVLALSAGLRVPLALRVPVHALQRVLHAVRGVHAALIAQAKRRDRHAVRRHERLPPGFDLPGAAMLIRVVSVVKIRTDPGDPVLIRVDQAGAAALGAHQAVADQILLFGCKFISQSVTSPKVMIHILPQIYYKRCPRKKQPRETFPADGVRHLKRLPEGGSAPSGRRPAGRSGGSSPLPRRHSRSSRISSTGSETYPVSGTSTCSAFSISQRIRRSVCEPFFRIWRMNENVSSIRFTTSNSNA